MWTQGRQGSRYFKWTLFHLWNRLDLHILKIDPNTRVPTHKDPVEKGRHWRLNITIAGQGTLLIKRGPWKKSRRSIVAFEPGALDHGYQNGDRTTYQISLGWRI